MNSIKHMRDISLIDLLEAGAHFGHKVERWHPKASSFIYQAREGVHIIDLAKTRDGLKKAAEYFATLGKLGKKIILVATKRQARGVVGDAANRSNLPYFTNRWIGGFLTNWDEVKKNIDKMNKLRQEQKDASWEKFPKHEIVKLQKYLRSLETVYSGVAEIDGLPEAIFMVDCKHELTALKEAERKGIKTVAIVDTNSDPTPIDYVIPANDDAVGSIQYIINYLVDAYLEGKNIVEKEGKGKPVAKQGKSSQQETVVTDKVKKDEIKVKLEKAKGVDKEKEEKPKKKRGRKTKSI